MNEQRPRALLSPHRGWVICGGCFLAFLGAAVNATYLIHLGTSVSHLTGDISKVAVDVADGHHGLSGAALNLITAAASFVFGAAVAGFFIHHPGIEFSRPYGRAIIAIAILLFAADFAFLTFPVLSICLAGLACGFQNALATHYRGMILRTTHVTGLLTDLGTNLGMKLRGHQVAGWKLLVPALLVLSFFIGAVFGSVMIVILDWPALTIIASFYLAGGIAW
ncbi:MAG: DUF1275 domain-containing protein, partial [Gloeobacteraceae cyanobacterium ES-bin-144]|nr:DUF1275 domain-containing protein [Verrucomicrobiales bacterium]